MAKHTRSRGKSRVRSRKPARKSRKSPCKGHKKRSCGHTKKSRGCSWRKRTGCVKKSKRRSRRSRGRKSTKRSRRSRGRKYRITDDEECEALGVKGEYVYDKDLKMCVKWWQTFEEMYKTYGDDEGNFGWWDTFKRRTGINT